MARQQYATAPDEANPLILGVNSSNVLADLANVPASNDLKTVAGFQGSRVPQSKAAGAKKLCTG